MPLSDDEYDSASGFTSETGSGNMSKAELRKTNKPIMEKKRRARINNCLNELKDLLLDAMNKDPARHSKLEKADILELTVKHLQAIQRQQLAAAVASDPAVLSRFRAGFGDCAGEVRRYMTRMAPQPPPGVRSRLASHLDSCISGIETMAPKAFAEERIRFDRMESRLYDAKQSDFREKETDFKSQRKSAFRYVRKPSPPLSPLSCDSACDSSTEPETPPRPQIVIPTATYPTPPSISASDQESSPETQKPTVSSTTISPESRQQPLDLKSKSLEPISIVIDVENYKIGIDASPKRPIDYRHKLKRTHTGNAEPLPKIARIENPVLREDRVPIRSVISHTAASLAESSVSRPSRAGEKVEADTSGSPDQKPQSSADMWRPW